jgi:hypothetical protein
MARADNADRRVPCGAGDFCTSPLGQPDLTRDEQAERWLKVGKYAPERLKSGKAVAESVMTAAIKAQMRL